MQIFWTYYIFSSIIAVNVSDKIAKHTYDWKYNRVNLKWFFIKFIIWNLISFIDKKIIIELM